jgi:phosphopantothenate-cysteine ligase
MNVLITAGGTTERIDPVRGITNSATGRLGALLAERFARSGAAERIFYIRSRTAVPPESAGTETTVVTDAAELEAAVRKILRDHEIDVVVHSMAVSDYRVRAVTTAALLAERLRAGLTAGADAGELARAIRGAEGLDTGEKLGSGEKDLVLLLEPTPKVIALFQTLAPRAVLVGFKLLDGVPPGVLRAAADALMRKNGCSLVLANDAREIDGARHAALLLDRGGGVRRFGTKREIADGIADAVFAILKGGAPA